HHDIHSFPTRRSSDLRKFYAANKRFKTDSTMYVQTVFQRPDHLQSTVTQHEGSTLIRSRVFDKILEAESETHSKRDRQRVDIIRSEEHTSELQSRFDL